jgi:hypothetical protein
VKRRSPGEVVAFVGPSLPDARERPAKLRGVTLLPPSKRGDVWCALERRPRAIALIDGVFEAQPSVWHHELLDAVEQGVRVFGASSMGALRAAELQPFGVVGVGQVFRWVRDGSADDADVALLHADAEHGFRALTVPQVTVRFAASQARAKNVITKAEEHALVAASARIFYQERDWPAVLAVLSPDARARWDRFAKRGVPDIKAIDARECIAVAMRAAPGKPQRLPRSSSALVRHRKLAESRPGELAALLARPDADELREAGTRRALIAAWAREMGLRAPIDRQLAKLVGERLAEDVALERLAMAHASRLSNDGSTTIELFFDEVRVREALAELARRRGRD